MAPTYAILFMDKLKKQILEYSPYKPLVWWHYIDYVFIVWQHGREYQFIGLLNNFHPSIKFTAEYSNSKVNFLDVKVILAGNYIKLYTKFIVIQKIPFHIAKLQD